MKRQTIPKAVSLIAGSLLVLSTNPAQAFTFTTNFSGNPPKGDIYLDSVELEDGSVISNFALVNQVEIIDIGPTEDTGIVSTDRGDEAQGDAIEDPTADQIADNQGNRYLSQIIDTEDPGTFTLNLFFDSLVDNLFFWERGKNSQLGVQAVDKSGNLLGNLLTLDSSTWQDAGFSLDTTEIQSAQPVGSVGVSLADLGVTRPIAGVQLTSTPDYNGPDFKVVAASVPEPTALAGIGLVGSILVASRRRQHGKAC